LSGFDSISTNNGWEYAFLGICIVFSGLVMLSLVISQLHKLLSLWDNRESLMKSFKARRKQPAEAKAEDKEPRSLAEARQQYSMLVERIGEPFALPKLLKMAEGSGLHRPHATINDLLQAGVLIPDETGYYVWKS